MGGFCFLVCKLSREEPRDDGHVTVDFDALNISAIRPKNPRDLIANDGICFVFMTTGELAPWNFKGPKGVYFVMPKLKLVLNDFDSMLRAAYAENGLGLTYIYSYAASHQMAEMRLLPLFDGQVPSLHRYTINDLTKRHMLERLRAFIDLAKN